MWYNNLKEHFFDLKFNIYFNSIHNSRLELLWNIFPIICLMASDNI